MRPLWRSPSARGRHFFRGALGAEMSGPADNSHARGTFSSQVCLRAALAAIIRERLNWFARPSDGFVMAFAGFAAGLFCYVFGHLRNPDALFSITSWLRASKKRLLAFPSSLRHLRRTRMNTDGTAFPTLAGQTTPWARRGNLRRRGPLAAFS